MRENSPWFNARWNSQVFYQIGSKRQGLSFNYTSIILDSLTITIFFIRPLTSILIVYLFHSALPNAHTTNKLKAIKDGRRPNYLTVRLVFGPGEELLMQDLPPFLIQFCLF